MTEELNDLSPEELGRLFPIVITEYDPAWEFLFLKEKEAILNALGKGFECRIDHIGSTAIPGLCAKPTIDILVQLQPDADIDYFSLQLKGLKYSSIPRSENPPPHLMFAKGYSPEGLTGQTYHLHPRHFGNTEEIIFRDYLIANPDVAQEYEILKKKMAEKFHFNRELYTESKTEFVRTVLLKARQHNGPAMEPDNKL